MMFSFKTCGVLLVLAATCNAEPKVDLGSAVDFVILAKTGISTVPASVVTGNIGVSPITASALTGWSLIADSSGEYSTSSQLIGKAYAADYISPTPSKMTTAISDMETAYTDATGRPNSDDSRINLKGGLIGGETLTPGVYTFTVDINIGTGTTLYFDGTADAVFVIQTSKGLIMAADTNMILTGGVLARNIFWAVAEAVDVGETAHMEGIYLVKTAVLFKTKSSLNGRVLAQTACNLQMATITAPVEEAITKDSTEGASMTTGPIVGIVAAGLVGLSACGGAAVYYRKKSALSETSATDAATV